MNPNTYTICELMFTKVMKARQVITAEAQTPAAAPVPGTARAAMLIASSDNPQSPVASLGSTVWSTIPPAPGLSSSTVAVQADADIPDLKMHATMTLRKNTALTVQATHTIYLKLSFANGAPVTGIKEVGLPQMRKLDSTVSEALTGVNGRFSDVAFISELAEQNIARNLDLMKTRTWFDFPMVLNDNRIAKLTFQNSPEGEAKLAKAIQVWSVIGQGSKRFWARVITPVPACESIGELQEVKALLAQLVADAARKVKGCETLAVGRAVEVDEGTVLSDNVLQIGVVDCTDCSPFAHEAYAPSISARGTVWYRPDGEISTTTADGGTDGTKTSPSRPGEFHPEPLTDPDVRLSPHPARATQRRLTPSGETAGFLRFPVDPTNAVSDPPPSLHGHYPASSLLWGGPRLTGPSVLSASRVNRLCLFP